MLAAQQIQLDHQQVVLAGGMESMSNCPYYLPRDSPGYGHYQALDSILKDGLTDAYEGFVLLHLLNLIFSYFRLHMGQCGEKTSREFKISREEQDDFAIRSYRLASEGWDVGCSLSNFHYFDVRPACTPQKSFLYQSSPSQVKNLLRRMKNTRRWTSTSCESCEQFSRKVSFYVEIN